MMQHLLGSDHSLPRPRIHRSHSHTYIQSKQTGEPQQNGDANPPQGKPTKPEIGRSLSFLEPTDSKPGIEVTSPSDPSENDISRYSSLQPASEISLSRQGTLDKVNDKLHRLHLPGSSKRHHNRQSLEEAKPKYDDEIHRGFRRHKYTQSEQHQYRRSRRNQSGDFDGYGSGSDGSGSATHHHRRGKADSLRTFALEKDREKHGLHKIQRVATGGLQFSGADASSIGYIDAGPHDPRAQVGLDPRRPNINSAHSAATLGRGVLTGPNMTSIELDLERADRIRLMKRSHATAEDVVKLDTAIADAEGELRDKLADINREGLEMTRRLDYGYYNLLDKLGNLRSTIHSFQSLSTQSDQLLSNFEHESDKLSANVRRKMTKFTDLSSERETRIAKLDARAKSAAHRAEDLNKRFENARVVVSEWEKREIEHLENSRRLWSTVAWTVLTILVVVFGGISLRLWWYHNNPVRAGLMIPPGGSSDHSLKLGMSSVVKTGDDGTKKKKKNKNGNQVKKSDLKKNGDHLLHHLATTQDQHESIPPEILEILQGIQTRNRERKKFFESADDGSEWIKELGVDKEVLDIWGSEMGGKRVERGRRLWRKFDEL